jgi:monovalent cation/proton antiporter MnhG/PhaG subunit
MSTDFWISLFLCLGVLLEWLCCIGLWAARDAYDKLHFVGPAASAGLLLFGIAILISEGNLNKTVLKLILIFFVLAVTGPVLTHVTALAEFKRGKTVPKEIRS